MKTKPIYLEQPYLKELEATILEVSADKEGVWKVILDQTIFYPMGGGQPTDQGKLLLSNGEALEVYQVLHKEGQINHYIKTNSPPGAGTKVKCLIDWERRYKNMKVHSAAHVIDFALYLLGYSPNILKPLKGDHGKNALIIYGGSLGKDIKAELQAKVDELIAKNIKFSWSFEQFADLEKEALYLQPGLPTHKPLRALRLEGIGTVADGGTIVAQTSEVGKVIITSIEDNGQETRIHYQTS